MAAQDGTFVERSSELLACAAQRADPTPVYTTSVSGMNRTELLMADSADKIARSGEDVEGEPTGSDDLIDGMTGLTIGSVLYEANAHAFSIGAETEQSLFDAIA
jgi:hypothetical protein